MMVQHLMSYLTALKLWQTLTPTTTMAATAHSCCCCPCTTQASDQGCSESAW